MRPRRWLSLIHISSAGAPWVGAVKLAKLGVDASKYLEAEERA